MGFEVANELFADATLLRVGDVSPQTETVRELEAFFSFSERGVEEIRGSLVNQTVNRLIRHAVTETPKGQTLIGVLSPGGLRHRGKFVTVFIFNGVDVSRHVGQTVTGFVADGYRVERIGDHAQIVLTHIGQVDGLATDVHPMIAPQTYRRVSLTEDCKRLRAGLK